MTPNTDPRTLIQTIKTRLSGEVYHIGFEIGLFLKGLNGLLQIHAREKETLCLRTEIIYVYEEK